VDEMQPQVIYRRWVRSYRPARNRLAALLVEVAKLFSNYEVHWLQTYATLGTFLFLLGLSLFLTQGSLIPGSVLDSNVHQVLRYLYLVVIILAAYVLDQRVAIWLAVFCTGIYLPAWVNHFSLHGWEPPTFEILVLLLSYNVFAMFASTMTAFGRDHRRLSDMVVEFESAFTQAFNLERLPPWILTTSIELTHASAGELYVVASEDGGQPLADAPAVHYNELSGLLQWALKQDRLINLSHVHLDPRFQKPDYWENDNAYLLMVPLTTPSLYSGLLVLWRHTNPFRKREEELIQLLVARGHLVIENARLHAKTDDALTQRANELAVLLDASNSFATTLDLEQLVEIMARKLVQVTRASGCQLYLIDEDGMRLVKYTANWHADLPTIHRSNENRHLPHDLVVGAAELPFHQRVLDNGVSVELRPASAVSVMTPYEKSLVFRDDVTSSLFLPLIFQEQSFGVAVLTQTGSPEAFSPDKIKLSEAVVREAVVALSNAWAFHSLKEAHQRIQLLIDHVAEGVFSVDTNRLITEFNPAAEELTGYSATDIYRRPVHELLVCEEQHCLLCRRDLSLQDAVHADSVETMYHCRAWIIQQNGVRRAVSHSVAPLISADQQITGAVSVVRDISKEEELVRMKSEFISLVSHQLRTPLTNISIAAEMLSDADIPHGLDMSVLSTLKQQSIRLRRLVDQVLMASRLERGLYQKPALEPLALRPLLQETLRIFETQHPLIAFPLHLDPIVSFALGDRVLMEVVLENLIQNAIDHGGEVTTVAVTAQPLADSVLITVSDDGDGIADHEVPEIFSPFRSGTDASKKRRGFGLGLYLTRMSVEAQGGRIWVERNEGHGTSFHFTLTALALEGESE
jgi:PAS domain S-box-containing protein